VLHVRRLTSYKRVDLLIPASDIIEARTLSVSATVLGGASNNSVESCTEACFASGYPLAGVEYSNQCCMYYLSPRFVRSPRFLKSAVPPSRMAPLQHLPVIAPWSALEIAPSFAVAEAVLACTNIPTPSHPLCRQQTFLEIGNIRDAWRTYTIHSLLEGCSPSFIASLAPRSGSSRISSYTPRTTLPRTVLHNVQLMAIPRRVWKMAMSAVCNGLLLWSAYDVTYENPTH
jgi:hypothetical protein